MHRLTFELNSKNDKDKLAEIAAGFGPLIDRGTNVGRGAVGQLIRGIAADKYKITLVEQLIPGPTDQEIEDLRIFNNRARGKVRNAVRRSKMLPARCYACACGAPALEYHHADYSKPLDVIPVCRACHGKLHTKGAT